VNDAFHVAAAIAIGACLSLQPPVNAAMARVLASPMLAASISIAISLGLAVVLWLTWGRGGGNLAQISSLPWWITVSGIVGVVFVAGGVLVAPILGVALFFVCVVAGQLLGSMLADHVGAFGLRVRRLDATKLIGLALVLAGAALVRKGNG
jgi:transporter family-2 protein